MNARKKGGDAGRSGLARNKLFGALGHVHNPFSMNLREGHDIEVYTQDESTRDLGSNLQVEMLKAEANLMVRNLISRIQKS